MNVLLMLYFMICAFNQKWYFPQGTFSSAGQTLIADTDRDGNYEFIFRTYGGSRKIYVYELHLPNTWEVDSFPPLTDLLPPLVWDIGDFDLDGLYNLVIQTNVGNPPIGVISINESPDSFSYPTQEVWRDTVNIGCVQPICVYDIDRDGIPEVLQTGGEPGQNYYINFSIYEAISDNNYEVKYSFESPETPASTIAFGDFDRDSLNEFVYGTYDGSYSIFESPENDSFVPLFVNAQLPTFNIFDCFAVDDADGDGKKEFVVKGYSTPNQQVKAFIFEATGDNTYEIIDTFNLYCWDYYGGHSDAGDVDGDGLPEIALEAHYNVYMIEAAGNDSFYVFDTLPGRMHGCSIAILDIDGNGYEEIVVSGFDETRIYEWTSGAISENTDYRIPECELLQNYQNIFKGIVNLDFDLPFDQETKVSLYDATGRLLRKMIFSKRVSITESKLPSGIYFLEIDSPVICQPIYWKFLIIR